MENENNGNTFIPVPGTMGGMNPMVNLFGNMTIIHQQQFAPRNPMMDQMRLMSDMANRQYNQIMQQRQLQLEEAKLAIEAKKIDLIQTMAENQLQLGAGNNKPNVPVFDNPDKSAALIESNINTDEAEDVEFKVIDKPVVTVKNEEVSEDITEPVHTDQPEYHITEDRIFYDFSPYSDYINLKKFFNELDGSVQDWLKEEINNTDAGKNRIYCDNLGAPGVVFIRNDSFSSVNLAEFWRNKFRQIYERYNKSVFKSPNITCNTDFIIFIMDQNYEFMHIINLIPAVNLARFSKTNVPKEIGEYKLAKDFVNWIKDNNSLVENKRIKSAVVILEPVIPDIAKDVSFNPDSVLTTVGIESAFDKRKFFIGIEDYNKKICEIYNIHS